MPIMFFAEGVRSPIRNREAISLWLRKAARLEGFRVRNLNIILCDDAFLLKMNKQYLNHHTLTDILTFGEVSDGNLIDGELYISLDRVRENAQEFSNKTRDELHRVMVHGLLHLCGHSDKTMPKQKEMRSLEDFYLSLRTFL